MPAVSSRSLPPQGMPCSGPRYLPAAISRSACLAWRERQVRRQGDDAAQFRIKGRDALQIDAGQAFRGELTRLQPARQLPHRREGDGRVRGRQRTRIARAAHEALARRQCRVARQHGIPGRVGREFRIELDAAWTGASFVQRRHAAAPVTHRLRALRGRELHLHELLGGREGCGSDLRAHRRRGAERGRRARRRRGLGCRRIGGVRLTRDGERAEHRGAGSGQEVATRIGHGATFQSGARVSTRSTAAAAAGFRTRSSTAAVAAPGTHKSWRARRAGPQCDPPSRRSPSPAVAHPRGTAA